MEGSGHMGQQSVERYFERSLRIHSWPDLAPARTNIDNEHAYLFTFCPPGPEDRLKVSSPMDLGMVSACSWASHLRAAWSSLELASTQAALAEAA